MTHQSTICFLTKPGETLLAMKKRGFGANKWNGAGGKQNQGETIEECAIRETQEEIGVSIPDTTFLIKVAEFIFHIKDGTIYHTHVFTTSTWSGEPQESEEMRPQWFRNEDIPYDKMWIDDQYWLPRVLKGEKLEGEFFFNEDNTAVESYTIKSVE
ncbi:MAG: 8-oxo-dGTP diphosphatase [Candidatus Pacebacteria bacterium]|nr:8-oxo-dGTP diphosphatase [Candidatus Paceibacterota bacterium]